VVDGIALVVLAAGVAERFGDVKQLAPAGPNGETLMDYSIHNGLAAGFGRVVVVVRSEIEEPVMAHLNRSWADRASITHVIQATSMTGIPAGTARAVLSARGAVGDQPLAVINADDLYGQPGLAALHDWLSRRGSIHALVALPLAATLLPDSAAVSRALCERRPDGTLAGLVESAVERHGRGFLARPLEATDSAEVDGSQLVSMNAFGFRPSIWPDLEQAVTAAGVSPGEARLPAVVAGMLDLIDVAVLPVADRWLGITWPRDLDAVRQEVRRRIEAGELPARIGSR
jgi:NDP-sugar pyrophosphorylase family protein